MINDPHDRHIRLIMTLDAARDSLRDDADPASMFHAILRILREQFDTDACAIMLLDEQGKESDLIDALGIDDAAAETLCWQAIRFSEPTPLKTVDWQHTLGLRVMLANHLLGGFFIARQASPFTDDERKLLETAESQIDSAVIQARTLWKLAHRNRELEAIYQIDRLRDTHTSESDLINSFTSLVAMYFDSAIAMLLITHIDTGEMTIRGLVTRQNIPMATLDAIIDLSSELTLPQIIPSPDGVEALTLLAAPLIVSGIRLGTVIVGRVRRFSLADKRLMYAVTSQMDSAIMQSRVVQQLLQRNRELEAIYAIDSIRDRESDFDRMMQAVLNEICRAVSSEMGYLMLYKEDAMEPLELKAATQYAVLDSPVYYEVLQRISRRALDEGDIVFSNTPDGGIRSVIAIPLILNDRIIGVFGTANSTNPRGFNSEDCRMLKAITSQVDTAIFERLERRRMRKVLTRSVDPRVLDHMLQRADEHVLSGDRVDLSVIFADLRGSTAWAERTDPEKLVETLNQFLGAMTDVIFKHGGMVDKFVGDEVIALFGVPVPTEQHAYQAVRCALEMQSVHQRLRERLAQKGIELPPMGVGVSSGEAVAGEVGSPIRTEFTAIGRTINLGARLCSIAPEQQIYISQHTYEIVQNQSEAQKVELVHLKGIGDVQVYQLSRMRGA